MEEMSVCGVPSPTSYQSLGAFHANTNRIADCQSPLGGLKLCFDQ